MSFQSLHDIAPYGFFRYECEHRNCMQLYVTAFLDPSQYGIIDGRLGGSWKHASYRYRMPAFPVWYSRSKKEVDNLVLR